MEKKLINLKYVLGCFFLIIASLLMLSSCNNEPMSDHTVSDNTKAIGRTYTDAVGSVWSGSTGSGIEFNFEGTKCSVDLIADNIMPEPNSKNARVGVFVDNSFSKSVMMNDDGASDKNIVVVDSIFPVKQTIRVIKLSESQDSNFAFKNISANGKIEATSQKDTKIEFVGDSIICGYGIDCASPDDTYSTSIENCSKSFAYKTATKLNADYSMHAISGCGVISGTTKTGQKDPKVMNKYYTNYGRSDSKYAGNVDPETLNWDFSRFNPDYIVINLGTNDASYVRGDKAKASEFSQAYAELLNLIRSKNPNAKIICMLGTMTSSMVEPAKQGVELYKQASGDANVYFLTTDLQDSENDGSAINSHPSEKTNTRDAEKLCEFISSL